MLAGDASERKFYRINDGSASFILMQCESPFQENELPYLNIWKFLSGNRFPVPEVLEVHPQQGIITLSDLGDTLLQNCIASLEPEKDRESIRSLCRKGVEIIVDLQIRGTHALDDGCFASRYSLDRGRFLFELDFFHEHYVRRLLGVVLSQGEKKELRAWFEDLSEKVAGFVNVLCHRDFHSRNLVLFNNRLYMTDFQDARLGPYTYDLASFLRDSYVTYSEDLIEEMLELYLSQMTEHLSQTALPFDHFMNFSKEDRRRFRKEFGLTCIQRNLKAVGTFAFQSREKKNDSYLKYIPNTLNNVKNNLKSWSITIPSLNRILSMASSNKRIQHDE